jgi:hypothetical protein
MFKSCVFRSIRGAWEEAVVSESIKDKFVWFISNKRQTLFVLFILNWDISLEIMS